MYVFIILNAQTVAQVRPSAMSDVNFARSKLAFYSAVTLLSTALS